MMTNPYDVLGISPNATDDEVKAAYREQARKYHPDNYTDNPLSDLAQEKMQEINEAYDTIVRERKQKRGSGSTAGPAGSDGRSAGPSRYPDIREMLRGGRVLDAEMLLDGIPAASRDAEWYFLKGSVLYRKGWLEDAYSHFTRACQMDPNNREYRDHLNQMEAQRRGGMYRQQGGGCSGCDVCSSLICADCCCECMGGDLIRCC